MRKKLLFFFIFIFPLSLFAWFRIGIGYSPLPLSMYLHIPSYQYSGYIVGDYGDSLGFSIDYKGYESKVAASYFLYLSVEVPMIFDLEITTNAFQWLNSDMTCLSLGYRALFFKIPILLGSQRSNKNPWIFYPKIGVVADNFSYDPDVIDLKTDGTTTRGSKFLYISGKKYYISELTAISPTVKHNATYISLGAELQANLVHIELIWLIWRYHQMFKYIPGEVKFDSEEPSTFNVLRFIDKDDVTINVLNRSLIFLTVSMGL
ncbi:MAG: hypothetical protein J7L34_03895 [Thermotogaceae bacterium]|nr:hypothetical protein [Thermotogaceae bacterium]